jgi:formylglycine-generating enzyme required for sulfatase activity
MFRNAFRKKELCVMIYFTLVGQFALLLSGILPGQPKAVRPKVITNEFGIKFVWIDPATFMMGSPADEGGREESETQHKVTLSKGFYMAVFPVTQEQWKEVMGNDPSQFTGKTKNLPVEKVSWYDCQEFISKLRCKDKRSYRLPTEAEWEYSCRAGTTTCFHFGNTISTDQANYDGRIYSPSDGKRRGVFRDGTTPVDMFPANSWGLYDLHGNVYQWCQDWYGDYPNSEVTDPQGPKTGKGRVVRGGVWDLGPNHRSAYRGSYYPDTRASSCGLRLCFFAE